MATFQAANVAFPIPDPGNLFTTTYPTVDNPILYTRSGDQIYQFDLRSLVPKLSGDALLEYLKVNYPSKYNQFLQNPDELQYQHIVLPDGSLVKEPNPRQWGSAAYETFKAQTGIDFLNAQQVPQQNISDLQSAFGNLNNFTSVSSLQELQQIASAPQPGGDVDISQGQTVNAQGQLVDSSGNILGNAINPNSPGFDQSTYFEPAPSAAAQQQFQTTQPQQSASQNGLTQVQLGGGQTAYIDAQGNIVSYTPLQQSPSGSMHSANPISGIGAANIPDYSNLPPEYQDALQRIDAALTRLESTGKAINPNIEIRPERLQEFALQAGREIDPYYANLLKTSVDGFLYSLGYSASKILENEKNIETKYGKDIRSLAEGAAEQGLALSGLRRRQEEELASDTASQLESGRRELEFRAGGEARRLAGEFGTSNIPQFNFGRSPTVSAGESRFGRLSGDLPLYNLSDSVYQGLIGSRQFEQEAAKRTRASELEEAERSRLALNQTRTITL